MQAKAYDNDILIHIGYHKTASTLLQFQFFNDPRFGFHPMLGHAGRLGARFVVGHSKGPDNPFTFCAPTVAELAGQEVIPDGLLPVVSYEDLSGHIYSGGQTSWQCAQWLCAVFPRAKVLITVREQQAMIRSCYDHFLHDGGLCGIDAFLQTYNEYQLPMFSKAHLRYDECVEGYQRLFGDENVLVLPYELLRDNRRDFVARILRFAEREPGIVDQAVDALSKMRNQLDGRQITVLYYLRLLNLLGQRNNNNGRAALGFARFTDFVLRGLSRFVTPPMRRKAVARLSTKIGNEIGDYYVASNQRLEALTGLKLGSFGYRLG